MSDDFAPAARRLARIGLVGGPALALLLWSGPWWGFVLDPALATGSGEQLTKLHQLHGMAAVAALMAVWWMTEALPMAATALVPLALLPLLKILPAEKVAPNYAHHDIFLYLGGFLLALAIEDSGLHRRVALSIVAAMGDSPRRVVLGFMVATALLSMWISNSATTLLMLPLASSILLHAEERAGQTPTLRYFGVALMLGIAYSASVGGMATLIGTPTNLAFAAAYDIQIPAEEFPQRAAVGFFTWMILAVPFVWLFLPIIWGVLTFCLFPMGGASFMGGRDTVMTELRKLGSMTTAERRIGVIFLITALLWVFREPIDGWGWASALAYGKDPSTGAKWINDSTVAMLMAVLCFLVPSGTQPGRPLLTWKSTVRLPWGVIILFGGGLALAAGLKSSGLDGYLGQRVGAALGSLPDVGKMAVVAFGITWLTELTSNVATVQMIVPVLAQTAVKLEVSPLVLMIPATLSASCAFMLPVATPPNAIVFGSGRVTALDMMKAGFWLNLTGVVLVVLAMSVLGPVAFGPEAMTAAVLARPAVN